nr:M14 family zinc carboxypeptidase [Lysobacter penaei]
MSVRISAASSLALALLLALPAAAAVAADPALSTVAERSGFQKTGRYDEVIALCDAFAERHPDAVRCETFGTTPEGRPMKVLVVSTSGALDPDEARRRNLPVTLVQGGIHAGEIDGKDAGFLALRQLLESPTGQDPLRRQVLLFVPVFNVDGHERFKAWNRPNQRGPEEMGWRTTARNLNLNRDYAKAEAPEMQAMLALYNAWDPLAYIDLHATDGAQFEHDISIQVEPLHAGDPALRSIGLALRDGVIARLAEGGSAPLPFYPSFIEYDNPASGFRDGVLPPRFSHGYAWLRNRFGMLVETHSWRPYPERVDATRRTILAVLSMVAEHGPAWARETRGADQRAVELAGTPVDLTYEASGQAREIEFLGYAYTRTPSEVSGALMTRYDESTPDTWRVPLYDDIAPALTVPAPGAGYIVPAAFADRVAPRLAVHGIRFERLRSGVQGHRVEVFTAGTATFAAQPMEGHQRLDVEGQWSEDTRDLIAGALFVPIRQPSARLVMSLLEPGAPDALLAWGEFNNNFERKEYMEPYVAEAVARDMLASDPTLRATFEGRLREDADFAGSPEARLDFFYRRHSAWDDRHNVYPVLRTDAVPAP